MEKPGLVLRAARGPQPIGSWAIDDGPVSIGSWPGATLPLDDERVLPVHAVLDPEGNGRWRLIALAPEGCTVNGSTVRRAEIVGGDRVTVGPFEIAIDVLGAHVSEIGSERGERAMQAKLLWRGSIIDTKVLRVGERLIVGEGRGATFRLPPAALGAAKQKGRWLAASCIDGTWHVALDTPLRAVDGSADVPLLTASVRTDGPHAPRGCEPVATWTPLPIHSPVRLESEHLAIELSRCDTPKLEKRKGEPFWLTSDGQRAIHAAMLFLFLLAMLSLEVVRPFMPAEEARITRELIAQFQRPSTMTEVEKERIQRWTKKIQKEEAAEGGAARAKGDEGRAGKPDAPERNARRAGPKSDAELVQEHSLLKALSGTGSQLAGGGALGAASAVGHLDGPAVGDARGTLGLGLRGTAQGGGGLSTDTVGVGPVDSKGRGFGEGAGKLGGVGKSELGIDEPASVSGGLDREVIRRVILSHRVQIRYCYEKQLAANPSLAGKVSIEFVIAADGRVTTARVAEQTLADPEVGRCIQSKVRTWTFPKPKGGGVVVVTYPFLFKPAGGGS